MKTKQGFLTIREFADQKGVSVGTIYRWIKIGQLPAISKHYGEVTLIPKEYLSLVELGYPGRPPGSTKSKSSRSLLSKEEKFNRLKRIPFSLKELQQLFEEGKTFREIADMSGVSYQAISQIYKKYFEPTMSSGWKRRKAIIKKRWNKRAIEFLDEIEKLSILKNLAEQWGYDVKTVAHTNYPGKWYKDRLIINSHLCRIYYAPTPSLVISSNSRSRRKRSNLYYRFNISKSTATRSDFILIVTGEGPHNIFIFPAHIIHEQFAKTRAYKFFYIPPEQKEPYHNMLPKIDWWAYLDKWDLLEK